jgi:hypothetical protein
MMRDPGVQRAPPNGFVGADGRPMGSHARTNAGLSARRKPETRHESDSERAGRHKVGPYPAPVCRTRPEVTR